MSLLLLFLLLLRSLDERGGGRQCRKGSDLFHKGGIIRVHEVAGLGLGERLVRREPDPVLRPALNGGGGVVQAWDCELGLPYNEDPMGPQTAWAQNGYAYPSDVRGVRDSGLARVPGVPHSHDQGLTADRLFTVALNK